MSRITRGPERKIIEIRSRNTTFEQAWKRAQSQFSEEIEGYPEQFQDFQDFIREVFKERRRAHLASTPDDRLAINREISERISNLGETDLSVLVPVFQSIRKMFDVGIPPRRAGRQ